MSYNIGQFNFFDIPIQEGQENENALTYEQYIKQQTIEIQTDTSIIPSISGFEFIDPYAEVSFNTQESYYLNFSVKRKDSEQNIKLKAIGENNKEQIIQVFKVPQSTIKKDNTQLINENNNEEEIDFFETVFSLNDTYNILVWQLTRTEDDYNKNFQEVDGTPGRIINIEECNLYIVKNILNILKQNNSNLQYLTKIGIQGPPLMLMSINRQQIRIGKNGIYELNNGINITSIGFIPKNENDFFIMDFEYQVIESNINGNNSEQQNQENQGGM